MDAAEMHALACRYALAPSDETLQAALQSALPLCALIARRFSGRGVEYDDLYQVASLACVSALKSFDPELGLKFTTFVTPTITGTVRNYLRDKGSLLRTPRALRAQAAQLSRAREDFLRESHREPTARELALRLGWELSQVLLALSVREAENIASLDQKDEDGFAAAEKIAFFETGFEKAEQRQDLARALSGLNPPEKRLLALRFQDRLSQRETARILGMSQMQVSRMERRLLTALRKEMDPPS